MWLVASGIWILFVVLSLLAGRMTMVWNGKTVADTPRNRIVAATLLFPIAGFVFWILGFIGKFMLSPIFKLFE